MHYAARSRSRTPCHAQPGAWPSPAHGPCPTSSSADTGAALPSWGKGNTAQRLSVASSAGCTPADCRPRKHGPRGSRPLPARGPGPGIQDGLGPWNGTRQGSHVQPRASLDIKATAFPGVSKRPRCPQAAKPCPSLPGAHPRLPCVPPLRAPRRPSLGGHAAALRLHLLEAVLSSPLGHVPKADPITTSPGSSTGPVSRPCYRRPCPRPSLRALPQPPHGRAPGRPTPSAPIQVNSSSVSLLSPPRNRPLHTHRTRRGGARKHSAFPSLLHVAPQPGLVPGEPSLSGSASHRSRAAHAVGMQYHVRVERLQK